MGLKRRRTGGLAAALLLLHVGGLAATWKSQHPIATVDISVIDIETGEPLGDVEITARTGLAIPRLVGRTDQAGRLNYSVSQIGRVDLGAHKEGYQPLLVHEDGGTLSSWTQNVNANDSLHANIGLVPESTAEGSVSDSTGIASEGAMVDAILIRAFSYAGRIHKPRVVAESKADKYGRFSFESLPPGDYIFRAWPTAAAAIPTQSTPDSRLISAAIVTYHPNASVISAAHEISFRPSETRSQINIMIRRSQAEHYRIPFLGSDLALVESLLVPIGDNVLPCPFSSHRTTRSGRQVVLRSHDFFSVPSGTYRLMAQGRQVSNDEPIWHNSVLSLMPGGSQAPALFVPSARVSGRIRMSAPAELPSHLTLSPSDSWSPMVRDRTASVQPDGSFELLNVNPGTHHPHLPSAQFAEYGLTIRRGGSVPTSQLTVASGEQAADVVIDVGSPRIILGELKDASNGQAPPRSYAVLMLEGPAAQAGVSWINARRTRSDREGRFYFDSVLPGVHQLAVIEPNALRWDSGEAERLLESSSSRVDIRDGELRLVIRVSK